MENYIDKLDELISLKRKKGKKVTKGESEQFYTLWTELANAEGFSMNSEVYLYDGFIYCGAKPFKDYIMKTEDPFNMLTALFSGSMFGKDCLITFKLLMHLLALLLNDKEADSQLICPIIERLPAASFNKEKKQIVDAPKILIRYFVNELDINIQFPPLSTLETKPIIINEFVALFEQLFTKVNAEQWPNDNLKIIIAIDKWLHPKNGHVNQSSIEGSIPEGKSHVQSAEVEQEPKVVGGNSKQVGATFESTSPSETIKRKIETSENPIITMNTILTQASQVLVAIQEGNAVAQKKSDELFHRLSAEIACNTEHQRQKEILEKKMLELSERVAMYENKVHALEVEKSIQQKQILDLQDELAKKDAEIAERIKMVEALSRDRAKQSDEVLHRIASKLQVEYKDFLDAETLPMDSDLGENMRIQLQSVFDILLKAGIALR